MSEVFERVMGQRKELVEKIVTLMKQEQFFGNQSKWDRDLLRPRNPLSDVVYRGGNRLRLMQAVMEHGYTDPRWATAKQFNSKGYFIKKGEHGIPCEKWIFTRDKKVEDPNGGITKQTEELEHPQVSYFVAFNANQVADFPPYEPTKKPETELSKIIEELKETAECPIQELAQDRAFYMPIKDEIVLPLSSSFKDETSFAKTMLHEIGHSTGHYLRLNRDMTGEFGSESYAKEELRAELGALFAETDLGITLAAEHYEDHSDYLKSWISILQDDPNELFRACGDAERICNRLVENYKKKYELKITQDPEIPEWKDAKAAKAVQKETAKKERSI